MRIQEARERKNIRQKDLAIRLGIAPNTLSQYETGKREPDFETLKRIADVLDTSTDYLLGRDDTKKEPPAQGGEPISPAKQALLDMVDGMTDNEIVALTELVKATVKMRGTKEET